MLKAIIAAVVVYLLVDAASDFFLAPIGATYLHAFIAMFCGMLVGGYLAKQKFVWVAVLINLIFSVVTYTLVARMREQAILDLVLEQHLAISLGSFVGAILGAWLGMYLAGKSMREIS